MTRRALTVAASLLSVAISVPVMIAAFQADPTVRIGLNQNAAAVTVRSPQPFNVEHTTTRTAKFTPIISLDPAKAAGAALKKEDLQYRMLVEVDGGNLLVMPMSSKIRIDGRGGRIEYDNRTYRGILEVFGNTRNTFTVVNELPMEEYLLGVVPNELSPRTFGMLEALKAQAVAARTYIVRNMGQYRREGYDICNTDACQVYFGAGTEDPLASEAVAETRGVIATYEGKPINALYSSTCGGRTENADNIFEEKLPYLVSVICEYKHPEPKPFATARAIASWKDAVLQVARVGSLSEGRSFLGLTAPAAGNPPAVGPNGAYGANEAKWLRENFYPNVKPPSDMEFLTEQGILSYGEPIRLGELLFRLIDKKGGFEWQQGVLQSWNGEAATLIVNGAPVDFKIAPDAPVYQRIGEDRLPMKEGMWIGGELMDFRAVNGVIEMLVYRKNFVAAAADRYSRLAMWQVHKTRQELEAAFKPLNIGELKGIEVLERGPSQRPVTTQIVGTTGRPRVRALRFRSLLGLRDSLSYYDEERNSKGELIGMSFYGQGWGHGVGMCQVGAFGMALEGATYEEILKKYYTGIELKKLY
jgi:stage II sporulation protein D